jgi:hypothetical protein
MVGISRSFGILLSPLQVFDLATEGKVCGPIKIIDEGKGIVVAREQQARRERVR